MKQKPAAQNLLRLILLLGVLCGGLYLLAAFLLWIAKKFLEPILQGFGQDTYEYLRNRFFSEE